MAISLERVKLSEVSGTSSSVTVDMSKIQEAGNGIVSSLQQISNNITTNIDGIKQTTQSLLDKAIPKAISSPDENAGIFGNILCGKIPSLNITLPSLNLNFLRDLDFDFDVTICGESKKVNPLDAALSVVKFVRDNKLFISSFREKYLDDIIRNRTQKILGSLGLPNDQGAINCILGDSKSNVYNTNDIYGNSLKDKLGLLDELNRDYCKKKFSDTFLDPIMENDLITKLTHSNILNKLFDNDDKNNTYSNMYFRNQLATPYRKNVLSATGNMFATNSNYNTTANRLHAISSNYVNPYYNVSTGTIRPTPLLKVNGFEVYDTTDNNELIYGYGIDSKPILGFTTEGKPIYKIVNNNPIIGYTPNNNPIYGYDRESGLPIIEITPSGEGVLESGLISDGYNKPNIANNKEEMTNTPNIGYLENNKPFYGYDEDGFPITSMGYTTTGEIVYGVDEFNNPIIGYTNSGKPIFGYDKTSGLPIVSITSKGTGVLESGKISNGFNKPIKANSVNDIIGYPGIELPNLSVDYDNSPITPYGSTVINNELITAKDLPYLQINTSIIADNISKMDKDVVLKDTTSDVIMKDLKTTLSITDKQWNKDDNNEEAYYKLKNEVMKDISIANTSSVDKTFKLTGIYTTKLTTDEKIAVSNLF